MPPESELHIPSRFICYFAIASCLLIQPLRTFRCTSDALSQFPKIQGGLKSRAALLPLHRYFHFRRPPRYLVASEELSDLPNLNLLLLFLDIQKHSIHIHEHRLCLPGEEILDRGFIPLWQLTLGVILLHPVSVNRAFLVSKESNIKLSAS